MVLFCCITAGLESHVADPQTSRIHNRFETVSVADLREISTAEDTFPDILGSLCRWHRRLCDLVDMVTSCYQLPLLVVISYCFVNTVIGTYTIISMFRDPHAFVRMPTIVWCCGYGSRLILVGLIPSLTVAEVGPHICR